MSAGTGAARRSRVLMVTPYPPGRDGIAAYAIQSVAALRAAGDDVEVLSPGPSAAHHHLDLRGPRGIAALAKRVRAYDRVIIQFHPDVFYPQPFADRPWVATSYALAALFRVAPCLEVVVHETDYSRGRERGPLARAVRLMWKSAPSVVVHTEQERQSFHEAFGVDHERIRVVAHGEHFERRVVADQSAARAALGLPDDELVFLSIGFIQPHKGFDRALRAFARLGTPDRVAQGSLGSRAASLHIVGSLRVEDPAFEEHVEELKVLARDVAGAHLHLGFVTDEEFDRWLVAADVVVLPYRHIWSSGVMERAALYERQVVVTRVGGLAGQARPGTVVVDTDDELADAMRDLSGRAGAPKRSGWASDGGPPGRDAVMAEIRARACDLRGATGGAARSARAPTRASGPLRRVPHLSPPPPTSSRPGAGLAKRVQRRITAWQIDPLVDHLNHLRDAAIDAADRLHRSSQTPEDQTPEE